MFVSTQKEIKVGDLCVTTKKIESFSGYFEVGTNVIVTDIGDRGYSLSDSFGNIITECGWSCIKKL